jgi:hypothetical protein
MKLGKKYVEQLLAICSCEKGYVPYDDTRCFVQQAIQRGYIDLAERIVDLGCEPTRCAFEAFRNDAVKFKWLVDHSSMNRLMRVIETFGLMLDESLLDYMIEKGVDINAMIPSWDLNLFQLCIQYGKVDRAKYLLLRGADPSAVNRCG